MRCRLCVFVVLLILVNIGCGKEENQPPTIVFGKIVGTYTGLTQVCMIEVPTQDTLCGGEISNTLRVVVYDASSIEISDVLGVYNKKKVNYVKTTDSYVHHFESKSTADSLSLSYHEGSQSLEMKNHKLSDSKLILDMFVGKK